MLFTMYHINNETKPILIPCKVCKNNYLVNPDCPNCHGNNTVSRNVEQWEMEGTVDIIKVEEIGRNVFGIKRYRYYVDEDEYFISSDKYVFFTYEEAMKECKKRNKKIIKKLS